MSWRHRRQATTWSRCARTAATSSGWCGRRWTAATTRRWSAPTAPTSSPAVWAAWAPSSPAGWSSAVRAGSCSTAAVNPPKRSATDLDDLADGTEIVFVAGDIATPGVAERLVAAAEETGRPLRGLVHGAGVTGDGLVAALTREGMQRVWAPKVAGALRLNAATVTRELDWWVGFSSMATLLGLPGQLAYATGNAWLDALMTWRRASGLPATAINWGQWSDVGMSQALTYSVLDPITPDEGIEALQYAGRRSAQPGRRRTAAARPRGRGHSGVPRPRLLRHRSSPNSTPFRASSAEHRATGDDADATAAAAPDWSTAVRRGPAHRTADQAAAPSWAAN